ncbi:hypothetical protein ACIRBX_27935 [Kitasatospora sp. NPDC096147]|uniref:hypothetical protein n=1 Tax=Kitasatospora sp. NPDC096147 TaxID=3364093 RepID=UPI00382B4BDF
MSSAETATTAASDTRAQRRDQRRAERIAKNIRSFAEQHGGSVEGVVENVSGIATRIVLVGTDGSWGDQVAPTRAVGLRAAELAGVKLHEDFEGELALRVRTGAYEWKRMAGSQLGG